MNFNLISDLNFGVNQLDRQSHEIAILRTFSIILIIKVRHILILLSALKVCLPLPPTKIKIRFCIEVQFWTLNQLLSPYCLRGPCKLICLITLAIVFGVISNDIPLNFANVNDIFCTFDVVAVKP